MKEIKRTFLKQIFEIFNFPSIKISDKNDIFVYLDETRKNLIFLENGPIGFFFI